MGKRERGNLKGAHAVFCVRFRLMCQCPCDLCLLRAALYPAELRVRWDDDTISLTNQPTNKSVLNLQKASKC